MDKIQPYLDYFALHPQWALAFIFLIAFGEALLVIGLVVPSTAVLVGAGALVGTGKLDFWPVMIATTLGCVAGDQVSYWAGRFFGERLKTFWPLSAYPHLVAKGEDYVRLHGGKSIALGRFVPGIKAVVPGIVGMFGMGQVFFLSVNISSGIVWSMAHLLPGIILGQALAFAGELSGRLLVILLLLLVLLGIAGWLIRIFSASLSPYRKAMQGHVSAWARRRGNRPMRRFARAIAPENPRSVLILLSLALGLVALFVFGDIASGRIIKSAVSNLDYSLFNLFSELRNANADELFIRITMLGDDRVLFATATGAVFWLLIQRNWRAALATVAIVITSKFIVLGLGGLIGTHEPVFASPTIFPQSFKFHNFKFPSPHAAMTGVVFGIFVTLANRSMARWSQALVAAACGIIVISISFSRLYLGVNWLSDVLAGLLLAATITTLYGVIIETLPSGRIRPLGLIASGLAVFIVAGILHTASSYDRAELRYAARDRKISYSLADWLSTDWRTAQLRRVDMAGKPEETFLIQWIGPFPALQSALEGAGYKLLPKWTWKDGFLYLDTHAPLEHLAPRPALHEGLKAKITAIEANPKSGNMRLTVRVFATNFQVMEATASPIYLVSLTQESLRPRFNLFSVPTDQTTNPAQSQEFLDKLTSAPQLEKLATESFDNQTMTILRAKQ